MKIEIGLPEQDAVVFLERLSAGFAELAHQKPTLITVTDAGLSVRFDDMDVSRERHSRLTMARWMKVDDDVYATLLPGGWRPSHT